MNLNYSKYCLPLKPHLKSCILRNSSTGILMAVLLLKWAIFSLCFGWSGLQCENEIFPIWIAPVWSTLKRFQCEINNFAHFGHFISEGDFHRIPHCHQRTEIHNPLCWRIYSNKEKFRGEVESAFEVIEHVVTRLSYIYTFWRTCSYLSLQTTNRLNPNLVINLTYL